MRLSIDDLEDKENLWKYDIGYVNDIIVAIEGFSHPSAVCAIVSNDIEEYNSIRPEEVRFFGYEEACKKHLAEFPNCYIYDNLRNNIVNDLNRDRW